MLFTRTLRQAGVSDPQLRPAYRQQARVVARYNPELYAAARLLLPTSVVPDVVAATAFMHYSDDLLDRGPGDARDQRARDFDAWRQEVLDALKTGHTDHPVLRPLLHTVGRHPELRDAVSDFLTAAPADLDFRGFATDADYQAYVDAYSLPGFMMIACLLSTDDSDTHRARCRIVIDAVQRMDFLADLAEDLADGRLALPSEDLDRFGVHRGDLEAAVDTAPVRALLVHTQDKVRDGLRAAWPVTATMAPEHRPMMRATLRIQGNLLRVARRSGTGVLRGSIRPAAAPALAVLFTEYRHARRYRAHPG